MNIYLAARYSRREEMEAHARVLTGFNHRITSNWVYGGEDIDNLDLVQPDELAEMRAEWALADMRGIFAAEAFIAFTEQPTITDAGDPPHGVSRGGRHVEAGIALTHCVFQGTPKLYIVGPRENIFYDTPCIRQFATADHMYAYFGGQL